jgi:NhaP-type Na+/H+ or K+/H+ antiporter
VALELVGGVVLGVAVPWAAITLERASHLSRTAVYEPLNAFAIGSVVLSLASLTNANEFLASFFAGTTIASISTEVRESFHRFGDLVTELLKLAALMVFGVAVSPQTFADLGVGTYVFIVLVLIVARPVAIGLALLGADIDRREWLAAAWFGPKGFASVVYALFVFEHAIPNAAILFGIVAVTITVSIVAHSSTDVLIARWFREPTPRSPPR